MNDEKLSKANSLKKQIAVFNDKIASVKKSTQLALQNSGDQNLLGIIKNTKDDRTSSRAYYSNASTQYEDDPTAALAFKVIKALLISGYEEQLEALQKEYDEL